MTSDLRRFYRCALTGERTAGRLIVRAKRLPCVIRNRSIEGFGIEVDNDPLIGQVNIALLECFEGTFPVEVKHLKVVEGRLVLGLAELAQAAPPPLMSSGQIRGWSVALGMIAALFLLATLTLALNAEQAADWLHAVLPTHQVDRVATEPTLRPTSQR